MYPQYNRLALIDVPTFQARAPEIDISQFNGATMSGILLEASEWIFDHCEVPTLVSGTITAERSQTNITGMGDLIIHPMVRPIISVQAIRIVKGGFATTLVLNNGQQNYFQVPFPGNKLVYPSSYLAGQGTLMIGGSQQLVTLRGANTYTEIDYTAGWPIVSGTVNQADLIRATVLVTKAILAERYNQLGAAGFGQGAVHVNFGAGGSDFYEQAAEILDNGGYHRVALFN